jgi:hypothetical protein
MKQETPRNGLPGSFWDVAKDIMGVSPTLANCGPFEGLEAASGDLPEATGEIRCPNRSSSIIPTKEGGFVLSMIPIIPDEDDDKREARV